MAAPPRRGAEYRTGELETILSLVPSDRNVTYLSKLLDRSEDAIRIVYKIAYTRFGRATSAGGDIQREKVRAVCEELGIRRLS